MSDFYSVPSARGAADHRAQASGHHAGNTPRRSIPVEHTQMAPARAARPNSGQGRSAHSPNQSKRPAGKAPAGKRPSSKGGGGGRPPQKKSNGTGKIVFFNILKACFVLGCLAIILVSIIAIPVSNYLIKETEHDATAYNLQDISTTQTSYMYAPNKDNPDFDPDNDDFNDTNNWVTYLKIEGGANSIWVPYDNIPKYMIDAAIATEDRDFETHRGFSIKGTVGAFLNQIFHFRGNDYGGSTITQQVIKNLTDDKEMDYKRKIREIYRAWQLENNYSKEIIMEAYLNTIPLSGTMTGAGAGAQQYFNKSVPDLTLAECATIVGITNSPTFYSPYENPDNCLSRRNDVLAMMFQTGKISEQEYSEAVSTKLGLYEGERDTYSGKINNYYQDQVMNEVLEDMVEQGIAADKEDATRKYYNSGLRILTAVDLDLQAEMERIYAQDYADYFPDITTEQPVLDENGNETGEIQEMSPQSAMVVLGNQEYDKGYIRGVVGGIGEKAGSLTLNRATETVRQTGSTMKPIAAYALAIDYGLRDYGSTIIDHPYQNLTYDAEGNITGGWPTNYGNNIGSGQPVSLYDALAKSLNTVAVKVGASVGEQEMYNFLTETLNVTTLIADDGEGHTDIALAPLVLGSMTHGMKLHELAACYQMFANGGQYITPHSYYRVLDAEGNIFMEPTRIVSQAIRPETAYIMNKLLEGPLRSGTASGMAPSRIPSIGKTGTTSDDKDRLFAGLTPYYTSIVWWGYDSPAQIRWSASASTNPPPVIWKTVMENVQADMPDVSFPEKPALVETHTYCKDTGQLAGPGCTNTQTGYYAPSPDAIGRPLPSTCTLHGEGAESAAT